MEEADKDWMIRMVGGWVFPLVPAHPGSPGQRLENGCVCVLLYNVIIIFIMPCNTNRVKQNYYRQI